MSAPAETIPAGLEPYAALDRRLLAAVRGIHILATVSWPASLEDRMIEEYGKGQYALPEVSYTAPDLSEVRRELEAIEREAGDSDPLGDYLRRTAESWRIAAEMLEAVGTDGVTAPSIQLYGRPGDAIPGSDRSNIDAAHYFVELSDELGADLQDDDIAANIPAETLRADLAKVLDDFFGAGIIAVEVDNDLTAKAAAGATRIRLRGGTRFTQYDRNQLLITRPSCIP